MSVEEARRKAHWGVRGQDQAGTHWTVWPVPPATPPSYGEMATRRRQGQLRAYREATGQEPWDVPGSWPKVIASETARAAETAQDASPGRNDDEYHGRQPDLRAPEVRRLPPGPVYGDRWTARPRWR